MNNVNEEAIKQTIKEWVIRIDKKETLPKEIIALNFGLYESYGIELIGSSEYDAEDDDWACDEDFIPEERSCPDLGIDDSVEWSEVLTLITNILKEVIQEHNEISLFQVEHITTGFCDGDLVVVK